MEKIKHFAESEKGKDILVVLIVILVGLASFELGRLSKENASGGLKIEYPGQEANVIASSDIGSNMAISNANSNSNTPSSTNSAGKNFFASKKGKKYYSVDCSAGKTIKEENKVYFATGEEAEKAGYTLSSACQ
jgi:hypothetical protein